MKKIFSSAITYLGNWFCHPEDRRLKNGVNDAICRHVRTLNKLEQYDTGEIQKSKHLAKHKSVRGYLQHL